jgi:hypothetical protein
MASLHSVGLRGRAVSFARSCPLGEVEPDSLAQETFDGRESLLLLRVGETELVAEALSCACFRQFLDLPDRSSSSGEGRLTRVEMKQKSSIMATLRPTHERGPYEKMLRKTIRPMSVPLIASLRRFFVFIVPPRLT